MTLPNFSNIDFVVQFVKQSSLRKLFDESNRHFIVDTSVAIMVT